MRRHLTYANVISTLCLVLILGGGAAYAANTIGSSDIIDESILSRDVKNGQVKSSELANNQVASADVRDDTLANGGLRSADIADGQLNGEDVGQIEVVNFTGTIGTIQANDCTYKKVTGLPLDNKDHFVLTPEVTTSETELTYTPKYDESETGDMWIQVCNHSAAPIDDGTTQFNLLEIDAR